MTSPVAIHLPPSQASAVHAAVFMRPNYCDRDFPEMRCGAGTVRVPRDVCEAGDSVFGTDGFRR